jgi:hypothetical protein
MNHSLTLRPPAPLRVSLLLILSIALWLTSAVSLAPVLAHSAAVVTSIHASASASSATTPEHDVVCHCAHCPGGMACCCRKAGHCATP